MVGSPHTSDPALLPDNLELEVSVLRVSSSTVRWLRSSRSCPRWGKRHINGAKGESSNARRLSGAQFVLVRFLFHRGGLRFQDLLHHLLQQSYY